MFGKRRKQWRDFADDMVRKQLLARGIENEEVLQAIRETPRHQFVSVGSLRERYGDFPLSIGYEQTISQPFMVGYMTNLLQIKPGFKVLEIGTGSGYQAAVLSKLCDEVRSVERIPRLARRAASLMEELNITNVFIREGDGFQGWLEHAPYDGIILTAAPVELPMGLAEQLKVGGRMIAPVGEGDQQLMIVSRGEAGFKIEEDISVRFVPMLAGTA